MAFDSREFRNALGNFATGVTIVTARSRTGEPLGLTANSFNSVSLDPPLVLFSLNRQAYSLRSFEEAGNFAINVLRDDQQDISQVFAQAVTDKWQGLASRPGKAARRSSPMRWRSSTARPMRCMTAAII
jgi:flavin reductase (DIM6/NTAB) family NADH-FMN oxidoreductase RutF